MKLTEQQMEDLIDELFHFDGTRWSTDTIKPVVREIEAAVLAQVPVGINGLTEAETAETASVMGIVAPEAKQEPAAWRYGATLHYDKLDALEFMRTSNDGYQLEPLYTHPATSVNTALLEALTSIAKNSCCDSCQEAARVARAAIAAAEGKV